MATCPAGHGSATGDSCEVCGAPIADAGAPAVPATASAVTVGVPPVVRDGVCAVCGAPRVGRYCEACGHDALAAVPAVPVSSPAVARAAWHVTVEADREYFDRVVAAGGPDAESMRFPGFCPPRRFDLAGDQVTIGRRSRSRGIFPGVDLVGPPEDPGVSHHHALLVDSGDGWAVVDLASTNGTTLNGSTEPLPPHVPEPLRPGDRVHVGAWTTITLHRSGGDQVR
ncbi:FHA domain-containing protein [Saccharothrix longispora]|uniref:FHA domain-containing protein n=1 Tax=Saccharothrix longispora TaxID=33920 RepID=UPI0028FD15C6|nr:FHA domain-containing protein [Saccharothrix longispora]MDU0294244.1 FHA domain-containing protein [Saccharothrix longispora]